MGRRGGPTVVFTLLLSIFSGSLRSPVLYKHITYIHTFKFNFQYGTAILSLYYPYPYEIKKETSPKMYNHFKLDVINEMDHMRISGTEPSSVILSQRKYT